MEGFKSIIKNTSWVTSNENVTQDCFAISFFNKGTASITLDDSISLAAGEQIVYPVIGAEWIYTGRVKVNFGATGTKKLLVTKISPE